MEQAEFLHTLPVGIAVQPSLPGAVSDYEERRVAEEYHYQWGEWLSLEPGERASSVAHSRIRQRISLASNDAEHEWHNARRRGPTA